MAAGSGTSVYPTTAGESVFSDIGGGLVAIAVGIFTGSAIKQTDQALAALYRQANFLAVQFTEFVIAELWWAAHLGTATSELAGYLDEAADSVNTLAHTEVDAWRLFLETKYPADLRALYNELAGRIPKVQKVNLQPIEAAIRRLQADDRGEHKWRENVAVPKLSQWTRFYAEWRTTYLPPLTTLRSWIKHPAKLSAFLLPSIVAQLPSMLRQSASLSSATSIEQALLATWTRNPDRVLDLILTWLTTEA